VLAFLFLILIIEIRAIVHGRWAIKLNQYEVKNVHPFLKVDQEIKMLELNTNLNQIGNLNNISFLNMFIKECARIQFVSWSTNNLFFQ